MKVYLAADFGRRLEMREVTEMLERVGLQVTSSWITMDEAAPSHDEATKDLKDVTSADYLLCFTYERHSLVRAGGGRHVEFGHALALGKRLGIVGPRETVFHYLTQVEVFTDLVEFIRAHGYQKLQSAMHSAVGIMQQKFRLNGQRYFAAAEIRAIFKAIGLEPGKDATSPALNRLERCYPEQVATRISDGSVHQGKWFLTDFGTTCNIDTLRSRDKEWKKTNLSEAVRRKRQSKQTDIFVA